ncbi:MAG: GNAT family N-acetyltransferase, partial [Caldilineae bacterium]
MQVRKIERLEDFIALRQNWEAVYAADPHAHIFVSWLWLRGWFQIASPRWFILAARPDAASPYVAFLPLQWRG